MSTIKSMSGDYAIELATGYLDALAFAESPERFQQSGQFDSSRFAYGRDTKEQAMIAVLTIAAIAGKLGIDVTDFDASEIGRNIAYTANHHGVGFDDMADMEPDVADTLTAIVEQMFQGTIDCEFKKRGDKIHMKATYTLKNK